MVWVMMPEQSLMMKRNLLNCCITILVLKECIDQKEEMAEKLT